MRVLFFAHARDATGMAEMEITISESLDANGVWEKLIAAQPKLADLRKITRFARNGEYANEHTCFTNSDEVALIPPVSGG